MARLLDQQDGLGIYAKHLLRQMLALDPLTRYILFVGDVRSSGHFADFANVSSCVLPAASKLWWDQVLVPRAARRLGVDLLFNPKFSLPLFTRIPGVFVLQSCDWYVNPANYPWWNNLVVRLTLPLYCRKARGLLSISQSTVDELARRTSLKVSGAAVTHAGVGANFTELRDRESLEGFRRQHQLPERFILTVARVHHTGLKGNLFYPGGNNERLIRAYAQYRRLAEQPLELVVAGHGVREYLLSHGFRPAQLKGIRFLGFVPNHSIHMAYQLAECFVLATLCESFGLPILEALATGCPAIVPATGAAPEVAGAAARFIDPYDERDIAHALLEVTGSAALRERLSSQGVVRARAFSWQQAAQRVLAVFDEVVPRPYAAVPPLQ
jgi:glycosyltransferase involved in cell wall biosynthesis